MANKEASLLLKIKTAGEDALDRVGLSFKKIGGIAVAAFGAISAIAVKSIADYRQQEEATNALTRSMANQGIYSKALKGDYIAQATALQKLTLYGDEQIIGVQAVLQGYLGQTKVSEGLTKATLNLAAAKKIDLATAAEMVGKSIGTGTNALARQGIEVSATASKTEKLAQVVGALNDKFNGQAEAAAGGLGALKQAENVMSDLFEVIGERLAPVVIMFANKFKQFGSDANQTNSIMDGFITTLQALTNGGVIVAGVFQAVAGALGVGLATAIESVSALIKGNFSQAFDIAKMGVVDSGKAIGDAYSSTAERMKEVNAAFAAGRAEDLSNEERLELESLTRKSEVKQRFANEDAIKLREQAIAQQQIDMELLSASEEQRALKQVEQRIKTQEQIYKNATDSGTKLAALNEIFRQNEIKKEMLADDQRVKNRGDTFAKIATLQNSNNSFLAAAGKAAAITQIAIETPVAIAKALSAFPPPFSFIAAGAVGVAMAAQAANIAGVQLAEGGVVMPRPGGTQATIGEAGQAEAVIPLDRFKDFGLGGGGGANVTIISYGGILGSESEAREFAVAVDRELLKLRQNNESVAFDSGVV
ncbi:hypothetical protein UFOVP903_49 [uncultured Caudovirales phage]|uniref:Uncharacterized protein n=1 Tax=uncultured Caudovirales phage TaxID=2100421 RepID=A0A6J5PDS5_9CAUD|nr:hypothetical protein UFOVP903_49 [uncultured Caudovirales phage]CAB4198117.1 hypothetical protein UFOVP1318_55 [uncultured Caudovirales phage]CAB4210812.1 hypothetical protein UFOVP1430_47 [uncultured Caudovirales phage]